MKSILALLLIVAVANAGTIKSGGLKGSWTDDVEVESASPDLTAPLLEYTDYSYDVVEINYGDFDDSKTYNSTDYYYDSITGYVRFVVGGELVWSESYYYAFDETGTVEAMFWTGVDPDIRTIPLACSVDEDDGETYCTFTVRRHMTPGTYSPSITLIDMFGNWATYDETDFTDATDNGVWMLQEEHPDTTMPSLASFALSEDELTVGSTADLDDDSVFTEISVVASDGCNCYPDYTDTDATSYDWRSSGLMGVYVQIMMGEDGEVVDWPLMWDEVVDDVEGTNTYGTRITFWPTMEAGEWTIVNVWAVDYAGNKNVMAIGQTITIMQDEDAVEEDGGVFSCQSFELWDADLLDPTVPYTLSATDDLDIYYTVECTSKTMSSNYEYVAVALQSPQYTPEGETQGMRQWFWNYGSGTTGYGWVIWENFGWGVNYETTVLGDAADYSYYSPSTSYIDATTGIGGGYVTLPPTGQDGDYELAELYTITEFGAMQRYSLSLGSASGLAPSVFAVAAAAAAALLL